MQNIVRRFRGPLGSAFVVLCMLTAPFPRLHGQADWFPFTLPWDDTAQTFVDASHLLIDFPGQDPAAVIAARGWVIARPDGHFYFTKTGRRARFWGVNFTFNANFPDHASAETIAARLAKLGVNLVRFHHMDYFARPNGIFDPKYFPNDTQHLDSQQLDRWDYLVAQLHRHGIYVNINLKVARHFGPGDGIANSGDFQGGLAFFQGVSHFNDRMIELQRAYARQLLQRRNPYTGLTYAEDPGVFCVEIANEDSLFGNLLTDGGLNSIPGQSGTLPETYSRELDSDWNAWLKQHYATDAALAAAWDPGGAAIDPTDRIRNGDFDQGMAEWNVNQIDAARAAVSVLPGSGPDAGPALRLTVTSDGTNWHVQLYQTGHAIEKGKRYELSFYAKASAAVAISVDMMRGEPDWRNYGLSKPFTLSPAWNRYSAQFLASETDLQSARPTFELGATSATLWIDQVEFREIGVSVLDPGEQLAAGTVTRPLRSELGRYSNARILDLLRFYAEIDQAYFTGMRRYLRDDLGIQSLVTGTAPWWAFLGDIAIQSQLDFVDSHYYWDHPWWPSVPAWSPRGWKISNRPLINELESLAKVATQAVKGKPFTLSEFNQSFPNQYALEAPLLIAVLANQQDWDAVYMFDFAGSTQSYRDTYTTSFFSLCGNPVKTAQMPVASRIFLGAQSHRASATRETALTADEILLGYADGKIASDSLLEEKGLDPLAFLQTALRLSTLHAPQPASIDSAVPPGDLTSDNGEWIYHRDDPERAYLELRGPAVQGAIGFLAGRQLELPTWEFRLRPGTVDHSAVILQSPDSTDLRESRHLLLSVWTEHQNTGMTWNPTHDSVDDRWGRAPTIIRPINLDLKLHRLSATDLRVYPLDETGRRRAPLAVTTSATDFAFNVSTQRDHTLWYEIEINLPAAQSTYSVNPQTIAQRYSDPSASDLSVGWIRLWDEQAEQTRATPLMEYSSQGVLTSIVNLPVAVPAAGWRFPALHEGPTTTAVSVVNPAPGTTAHCQLQLYDSEGAPSGGARVLVLEAQSAQAFYLAEKLDLSSFQLGTVAIACDREVGLLVLRSTRNARGETFLTPVPIRQTEPGEATAYFTQLAAGPAYATELTFLNDRPEPLSFTLSFFNTDGSVTTHPQASGQSFQLLPGQVRLVRIPAGALEYYGYGRLDLTQGANLPRATAVITQLERGQVISELAIPPSSVTTSTRLLAPERRQQRTALAFLNPGVQPIQLSLELEANAEFPTPPAPLALELAPGERRSLFLWELFPDSSRHFNALLRVESDQAFLLLPLLGIFNARGQFLLSPLQAFPVPGANQAAGIIGRLLSGQGYRTVLYLDAPATTTGELLFFDTQGQPLPLPLR